MSTDGEMVMVNREALEMLLACFDEGADEPQWRPVFQCGWLMVAYNELSANVMDSSDELSAVALREMAAAQLLDRNAGQRERIPSGVEFWYDEVSK